MTLAEFYPLLIQDPYPHRIKQPIWTLWKSAELATFDGQIPKPFLFITIFVVVIIITTIIITTIIIIIITIIINIFTNVITIPSDPKDCC